MKLCKVCKEEIHDDAVKCSHCQAYQNWRHYMGDVTFFSAVAFLATIPAFYKGYVEIKDITGQVGQLEQAKELLSKKTNQLENRQEKTLEATMVLKSSLETIQVQSLLQQKGLYDGPLDGSVGKATENALKAFQRQEQLSQTGKLDPKTLEKLGTRPLENFPQIRSLTPPR